MLQRPPRPVDRWSDRLPTWTVPAAAAVAVLGRLPFLARAPSPDEAGYLLVGAQWDGAGSSLYGSYWVDRPPLLVSLFRLAAALGGVPALRLIGCVAALLVVVGAARAARLLGGPDSARWTSIIAAALCLSPLLGVYAVNGELLAAPFVVGGVGAVVSAVQAPDRRRSTAFAAVAGAAAVCAVLVKQNFVDVAVFAVLATGLAGRRRELPARRVLDLAVAFVAGAAATLALTAGWTAVHGTSLGGVFDAMYPFRVEAGHVIAAAGRGHATARLGGLVAVAALSGLLALTLGVLGDAACSRRRRSMTWALAGLVAFASVSVLLGGSYWHHYLIGLVVPVSIAAGLLAGAGRRWMQVAVAITVGSAALTWAGTLTMPQGSTGQAVGTSIGAVSDTGDSIVSLYGHADVVHAAGLPSPYEHLWSLPIKTLDPHLVELDAVLSGPDAPTWLVTGRSVRSWGVDTHAVQATIRRDYRPVRTLCDRTVFLRADLVRAEPDVPATCDGTTNALTSMKDLLP